MTTKSVRISEIVPPGKPPIRIPQFEFRNFMIAISCENLGKKYRIGQRESYRALRDVLTDSIAAPARRPRELGNSNVSIPFRGLR